MRKLCWFSGGFAVACLLCCYGAHGLYRPLSAAFGALAALCPLLLRTVGRARLPRLTAVLRRLSALCLGGVLAAGWFWGWTALFRAPAAALAGQTAALSGTVTSWPDAASTGGYSLAVELDGGFTALDVLLYATGDWGELRPGDRVRFTARLEQADHMSGSETTYYTAKGIFLLGRCKQPPESVQRPERLPVRFWPAFAARALRDSLYAAFDADVAPLCAAMVTGDRSGLDEGLSVYFSRSGAAHVLVVSGMHVSCLVMAAMALLRDCRRLSFAALPLVFFYAFMAGASPSALRAACMQAVLLCAPLARRESDAPTALAAALLPLLLLNPYAAGSVSLQLSFGSVAGILAAAPRLAAPVLEKLTGVRKRHAGNGGWRLLCRTLQLLACSLCTGLGAMLFSQPVLALCFHQASLVFPLTNLLVLGAVQLLLPAALFTGCLGLALPGAARCLGWLLGWAARYVAAVVTSLGRWRFAAVNTDNFFCAVCVAACCLFLSARLLPGVRGPRGPLQLGCLALLFGAAFLFTWLPVHTSLLTVAALDVGQGACTAFISGGRTALADCGGSGADSAGDVAADYFAALGSVRLDYLILTHFDADHTNGLERLFDRMEVGALVIPPPEGAQAAARRAQLEELARSEGAQVVEVSETVTLALGDAVFTLYPPLVGGTSNESGLFALCSAGRFDALITGDAGALVERMLVKYCPLPDIELLMVGHHGAADSASDELLDAVKPELAALSVGWNSYGHPASETLERLRRRGIPVYRTDELGTVSFFVTGGLEEYKVQVDTR